MVDYFDFEKPIKEIELKIESVKKNINYDKKIISELEKERNKLYDKIYSSLSPWQKVQVARHPKRPHSIEYINNVFNNFIPLAGDKKFSEDKAIIGGLASISEFSVMVIGTEKGNSMESRIEHNFGMAKPEGYRKVQRLFDLAEKFEIPIVTLVDTAGAYPGKEAEERGQSESIASSIAKCLKVKTPIVSVIIGEGGSGGAIALATADVVYMLQNSIYSVISPEGCASILWRNNDAVQKAADSLKLTADECLKFKIIDEIITEHPGGAHRFPKDQYKTLKEVLSNKISQLKNISSETIVKERNSKFLNITNN